MDSKKTEGVGKLKKKKFHRHGVECPAEEEEKEEEKEEERREIQSEKEKDRSVGDSEW